MRIRSSSGNGEILDSLIVKFLAKDKMIRAAQFGYQVEGEKGAEAVLAAALIDASEAGIRLEESDLDYVISKVYKGEKLQKQAQYIGKALRGLGKGLGGATNLLGNLGQGVANLGKGAWEGAKAVGKGVANLPQAMEQKGYQMEQNKYQTQLQDVQNTAKGMTAQYQRLQGTLGNLGRTTMGLQNALQSGQITPDMVNTAQGLVKSLINQLNGINQSINTLSKYKAMKAPVAPVKNQPITPFSPQVLKQPAQPQTLPL